MDNVRKNQYTGFNSHITEYTRKLRKNMTKQDAQIKHSCGWYLQNFFLTCNGKSTIIKSI